MARSHRFVRLLSCAALLLGAGSAFAFPPVETFDEITAPALPPGWISLSALPNNPGPGWITVADAFSSPNAAFAADEATITDQRLTTPPFHVFTANGRVTFQHKFDLEYNAPVAEAYDGVALEIAVDGQAFVDITVAGGSFASGGYNGTTPGTFGNPLAGRDVWSGLSQGYQGVVVNLPAAANDRDIQLRWRMGTDSSFGQGGYWLDDIRVYGATPPTFPPDETFDEVAAPELPIGWINDSTGPSVGWISVINAVSSPPNAAFTDDTAAVSDLSLETPPFDVVVNGRVTFLQLVNLESSAGGGAYDGVVLEISIDDGTFVDILDAGGSFVSGGYDHTTFFGDNPLSGRPVWSGANTDFQNVVVNLPTTANGRSVRLRWRMGTDSSTGLSGYWLDDIHVYVNRPSTFPSDETFSEVIPPDLPANWINDHTGTGPGWITVNDFVSSPPNAAFTEDTAAVSDKSLETPPFDVVTNGQVAFSHKLDLEIFSSASGSAFDGVVLEIAYDNGAFVDIVDAGGAFVFGGYDFTIINPANPLSGRAVWSGTSPGYVGVLVDLPAAANGRSVRLRWRMGTDPSTGLTGYWLDDIHVVTGPPANDEIFGAGFGACPGPECQ